MRKEIGANLENEDVTERTSSNKRGLTSEAWAHFKREKINEKWKAICKHCDRQLGGDTNQGTKHLYDHIQICKLCTVRGPRFCRALQPLFKVITRNTWKVDIMKVYDAERSKVMKLLEKATSRTAITIDMWTTTNQNKGYMSVTAHFIDNDWTLQNRLLRFTYVPTPHITEVLADVLCDCIFEWNLETKLSTLTVDNCSTNVAMIAYIVEKLDHSSFILGGSLFHTRCCAHILTLIVKDGMSTIHGSIEKIRDSASVWTATPKREEKFIDACRHSGVPYSKKLVNDCRTRWNSMYLMLVFALPYYDVFKHLKPREPQYKSLPSLDEWKMTTEICNAMEIFYRVIELFSGTQFPTSNVYFPKVCEIRLALNRWVFPFNTTLQAMAETMIPKFEKYWDSINSVIAIRAVLNPRFKIKLLNYFFPLMYGSESTKELEKVRTLLEDLVSEYQNKERRLNHAVSDIVCTSASTLTNSESSSRKSDSLIDFLQYIQDASSNEFVKFELDYYLKEPVLLNQSNVDNIGGQFLAPHRSSLNEDTVEAMIGNSRGSMGEQGMGMGEKNLPIMGIGDRDGEEHEVQGQGAREYPPPTPRASATPNS
ncbi:zinc finger BED domain-containing protein RICESLEEPER 2-like [Abrus precatorius]|uniref:Zinc finger BED domain-containing protein RICESLEEPER 2-like n=1 Tax=Abrus precatorius TaxID=3816 RepID=A0A8B8MHY9_ABRPR|nr:zinc finger BED domain-containing protein RICESLEEPER 2-like [Abrus precatorius]